MSQHLGNPGERFGIPFSPEAVRQIAFRLIVGETDTGTSGLSYLPGEPIERLRAMQTGTTRVDRLTTLHEALVQLGAESRCRSSKTRDTTSGNFSLQSKPPLMTTAL